MKKLEKEAAQELIEFLAEFKLSGVVAEEALIARLKKTFKRYYPLLLLQHGIERTAPWSNKSKTNEFDLYFREAISDICQAVVLAAQGFYKPSQLSLRSGLENWIRCVGLSQDQSVLTLKSVFELIDLVRSTPAIKDNKLAKQYFETLRGRYSSLCGYVHTANAAHMALTTFAAAYPRYLSKEAEATFSAIDEVCSRMTYMFCIVAEATYRGMHHSHFDIVSDALPAKLKAELNDK